MSTFHSDFELPKTVIEDGDREGRMYELDIAYDMIRPVVRVSLDDPAYHQCFELSPEQATEMAKSLLRMAQHARGGV